MDYGYCNVKNVLVISRGMGACEEEALPGPRMLSGDVRIILFKSSNHIPEFRFNWKLLKVDSTCSRYGRTLNGTSGSITSPNFPNPYGRGVKCKWIIIQPNNSVIRVSFDPKFELDDHCLDKLIIRSMAGSTRYCGKDARGPDTHYGDVTIEFTTDIFLQERYAGFKLDWRRHQFDTTCNESPRILNRTTGSIATPNYPKAYGQYRDCKWKIVPSENMVV
ncbi:neuropilin-2-like isoform X1 [Tubulanus polymorphus]|uniref:neuropilin-2-like isoform X1 n=1 Tax=Tubulanus polymorphus TaxID=672921 RepID=UPI003DA23B63